MNYTALIIAAGWMACGVGGAGFAFADFQSRDQLAATQTQRQDLGLALLAGIVLGPAWLLISFFLSWFGQYGWRLKIRQPTRLTPRRRRAMVRASPAGDGYNEADRKTKHEHQFDRLHNPYAHGLSCLSSAFVKGLRWRFLIMEKRSCQNGQQPSAIVGGKS